MLFIVLVILGAFSSYYISTAIEYSNFEIICAKDPKESADTFYLKKISMFRTFISSNDELSDLQKKQLELFK